MSRPSYRIEEIRFNFRIPRFIEVSILLRAPETAAPRWRYKNFLSTEMDPDDILKEIDSTDVSTWSNWSSNDE